MDNAMEVLAISDKTSDINNNNGYFKKMNSNDNTNSHVKNKNNLRKVKKVDYRRYRSGSSSDSAINFENSFEKDEDFMQKESTDIFDDFNAIAYNFSCLVSQKQIPIDSPIFKRILTVMKKYYNNFDSDNCVNKFGFVSNREGLRNEEKNYIYFEHLISELFNANSTKYWSDSCESIKCLIRDHGIPNTIRAQIWLIFIRSKIGDDIDTTDILCKVSNESATQTDSTQYDVYRQIDLDIRRTFPNHQMFVEGADGISRLRKILIGYCIHVNPKVGYCQGMNFIAALLLIVFDGNEQYSLMGLIAIIDHYFPPHYYDHHLTGARADQMLLKDLISSIASNMKIETHLNDQMLEEITSALSLNWFLSLFHASLPWQVRLFVIDCFWLEGVKVLFRFSLAFIKMGLNVKPEEPKSSGDLINLIRDCAKNCYDIIELKKVAFHEIKLPKRKYMATKRSFYVKQITTQLEKSIQTISRESTTQWIRRRSSELLGLRVNNSRDDYRIVISSDRSKVAVFRKTNRIINEVSVLYAEDMQNVRKTQWCLKNPFIIGISNDANRIICSHCSSKTVTKAKDGLKLDLIGVNFEACDGFYIEESNFAIIISTSGLVSRYMIDKKQTESIMILNDNFSNIVSTDLNKNCGLVWLDTVSRHNNTHKFIAFDINSLDIYTTIETDCFSVHMFSINVYNDRSVIIVKSDPINGKLKKTIDILTNESHKERLFDSHEDILDIKCFSLNDQNIDSILDLSDNGLKNPSKPSKGDSLLILVTKNLSNICIEYKYQNFWKKSMISIDKVKDISEINAIKIVRFVKNDEKNEIKITLVVNSCESSLIDVQFLFSKVNQKANIVKYFPIEADMQIRF